MPAPTVLKGEKTKLQLGDGATPEVFTDTANVVTVGGPKRSVAEVKTTAMESTEHNFRPSELPDNGEVTFQVEYNPADATHTALEDLVDNPAEKTWRIVFNNGTTTRPHKEFPAFVKSYETSGMEVEGTPVADLTLRITGAITSGTTTLS